MKAAYARDVCLSALQVYPKNGMVLVNLARALNKLEYYSDSAKYAQQAVDLKYPFGYHFMLIF